MMTLHKSKQNQDMVFFQHNFGAVIFAIGGILIIPQLFYLSNLEEFSRDIFLLTFPILLCILVFLILIKLPIAQKGQLFLAGLGLSILICDQFLRADIAHLDGAARAITSNSLFTVVNCSLYVVIPIIFIFFGQSLRKILSDLSVVMGTFGLVLTAYCFTVSIEWSPDSEINSEGDIAIDNGSSIKEMPNIYFIWLDAMETGFAKRYFADSQNKDSDFSGFVLFENNSSNYLYTAQSYPSFMSGSVFTGGDNKEWESRADYLRQNLIDLGYSTTAYAKKNFLSSLDQSAYSSDQIFEQSNNVSHPFIKDYITYWIVRSVPTVVANESLKYGSMLGDFADSIVNRNSATAGVKTILEGIEPVSGVMVLDQLIQDEVTRKARNEFVIGHALVPHGPFVVDRLCNYRGKFTQGVTEAYYDQVVCSLDLTSKYLDKLKELDRYNSSMIVIMGDHGSGWAGRKDGDLKPLNDKYMPWSKSMVLSRSSALLMVKLPGDSSAKPLEYSARESQLVDIYPTILAALGRSQDIPPQTFGIDLFSRKTLPSREKYITYFKPARVLDASDAEIYHLKYQSPIGLTDIQFHSKFTEK